ncbi:hypothetical protein OIU79_025232 [Salix purpurea]|uniref:Uncharacterized protein n=1 Tax=Salix purpurea TaxID=77065 RepID=A0A9Q1A757_SALPP|nr:hypothetical protein OIU79_025232 [Salix purpurea]
MSFMDLITLGGCVISEGPWVLVVKIHTASLIEASFRNQDEVAIN